MIVSSDAMATLAHPTRVIDLFVIYERPLDYPSKFVVRRWHIAGDPGAGGDVQAIAIVDTIELARAAIPAGRQRIVGIKTDDPTIAEVYE
jgi:hypothetical protein